MDMSFEKLYWRVNELQKALAVLEKIKTDVIEGNTQISDKFKTIVETERVCLESYIDALRLRLEYIAELREVSL